MSTQYRNILYKQYFTSRGSEATDLKDVLIHREYYNDYFLNHFLPKDKSIRILDMGCGYGTMLASLQNLGYSNFTGVDFSSEAIKVLRQTAWAEKVIEDDVVDFLEKAVQQNLTWDVVLAIDILEHFSKDELVHLLTLLKSLISTTGFVIIKVPNAQSPMLSGNTVFGDFTHEIAFTPASLSQVLIACGFHSVENHEASPVPYTLISHIRFYLWRIIRLIYTFFYAVETGSLNHSMIWTRSFFAVARKGECLKS